MMARERMTRRDFLRDSAAAAAVAAGGAAARAAEAEPEAPWRKTRSYNADMQYRRLGKTGPWVSAVCLGGHWKRIDKVLAAASGKDKKGRPEAFADNRREVVGHCLERGINYIDACTGGEIMAYSKAVKGMRDKVYFGFSWAERESRNAAWRPADKLLEGFERGLKEAGLEYADVWRITAHERGSRHTQAEAEAIAEALVKARKQGKARFTGVSSHDHPWLKMLIETYGEAIQVILFPYTADSKELPVDSLFDAIKKHDIGVFGIKPFSSNALFKGNSAPDSPHAEADDRVARLAIRHILRNAAITAPIPGLISTHQVDNAAQAVKERRELDLTEKAELQQAAREMWAKLPQGYQWLKDWRYV